MTSWTRGSYVCAAGGDLQRISRGSSTNKTDNTFIDEVRVAVHLTRISRDDVF